MVDIKTIQNIVREAAKLFSDRTAVGQIKEKGTCDYVTAVDEAVQKFVRQALGRSTHKFSFWGKRGTIPTLI